MKRQYLLIVGLIILFSSCTDKYNNHKAIVLREKRESPKEESKEEKVDNTLLKVNQVANEKEIQKIKGYIQRRKWQMQHIKEGVFVESLLEGKGKTITSNSIVTINCKIELLDGTKVFDSKIDGAKVIDLKSEQDVVGLVYVLNGLKEKTKLRAVVPSFLAFGLKGDGDRIPKRSSLVYEIEIKEVK
ncbi:MAG: FKBP-type peptidyl-prolyl cis-trans isomerase [Bacteroidales bacterium]|jgi:FKBP-type peptidyl-prolyl cis-trans isomerase|nr:FKBP-type peptidyl-prolyl cis-trans isomerase [Bacteroidales bacterium]